MVRVALVRPHRPATSPVGAERRCIRRGAVRAVAVLAAVVAAVAGSVAPSAPAGATPIPAGRVLRVHVPEAFGGKTVIGQLTVAGADRPGHVTAYPCADGIPTGTDGKVTRSDLNYFGNVAPIWSNRLIVEADDAGDICFHTLTTVELVVNVNGVSFDNGIESFPNRRTDTRTGDPARLAAGETLRLNVPEAVGGRAVIGQMTVANPIGPGHVIAYPCDLGRPGIGQDERSDLNYFGNIAPIWSNRLIVQADGDGDICIYVLTATDLVIDINGVADTGISSFPNQRTDTRTGDPARLGAGETLRLNVPAATGGLTVIGQVTVANPIRPGPRDRLPVRSRTPRYRPSEPLRPQLLRQHQPDLVEPPHRPSRR